MAPATQTSHASREVQQKKWGLPRQLDETIQWDTFYSAWERAQLLRAFIWNQEYDDEKKLFKQVAIRLRRLFNTDFCLVALYQSGGKLVQVGDPEVTVEALPPNFVRQTLDLIASSRVPLTWNLKTKESPFRNVVVAPVTADVGKPVGFIMLAQTHSRSFGQVDLFILQALAGELGWALRNLWMMQHQQKLVTSVAQELKSCLGAISNDCDQLTEQLKPAISQNRHSELHHISQMTDEIHRLMHALSTNLPHEASALLVGDEINLPAMVEEIALSANERAKAANIELVFYRAPDLPSEISADVLRLKQVIRNLIHYAIDFHGRSVVQVAVRRKAEVLEIAVSGLRTYAALDDQEAAPGFKALDAIKEQLEFLAGHMHITSSHDSDAKITACVPCL